MKKFQQQKEDRLLGDNQQKEELAFNSEFKKTTKKNTKEKKEKRCHWGHFRC